MALADEDLRHRAPAGELHHVLALNGVQIDAYFFDLRDTALLE